MSDHDFQFRVGDVVSVVAEQATTYKAGSMLFHQRQSCVKRDDLLFIIDIANVDSPIEYTVVRTIEGWIYVTWLQLVQRCA